MNTIENKHFKFKFSTKWNEEDLLFHFRKEVLKNPKLYSNNNFGKLKPIRLVKSFNELNLYIQSFHFEAENYPLYFCIAVALKRIYEKYKNQDDVAIFEVTWGVGGSEPKEYRLIHELPFNNKLNYSVEIESKYKHKDIWNYKK